MDGLDARGHVFVIAATNRHSAVDPALRRPGRFDREIEVGLPDLLAREQVIASLTATWPEPVAADGARLPWHSVHRALAERTEGYTGADLESLVREAMLSALRGQLPALFEPGKQGGRREAGDSSAARPVAASMADQEDKEREEEEGGRCNAAETAVAPPQAPTISTRPDGARVALPLSAFERALHLIRPSLQRASAHSGGDVAHSNPYAGQIARQHSLAALVAGGSACPLVTPVLPLGPPAPSSQSSPSTPACVVLSTPPVAVLARLAGAGSDADAAASSESELTRGLVGIGVRRVLYLPHLAAAGGGSGAAGVADAFEADGMAALAGLAGAGESDASSDDEDDARESSDDSGINDDDVDDDEHHIDWEPEAHALITSAFAGLRAGVERGERGLLLIPAFDRWSETAPVPALAALACEVESLRDAEAAQMVAAGTGGAGSAMGDAPSPGGADYEPLLWRRRQAPSAAAAWVDHLAKGDGGPSTPSARARSGVTIVLSLTRGGVDLARRGGACSLSCSPRATLSALFAGMRGRRAAVLRRLGELLTAL